MPFGRTPLTWAQLQAVCHPTETGAEGPIWLATLLAPHLRERLVEVTRRRVTDRPPLRFQVYQLRQWPAVYVLVDDHGVLKVGAADLTDDPGELPIPDFDRRYTEVVSLTPTAFDRRADGVVDIWIVVRQWPRDETSSGERAYATRAYHAIVKRTPDGRFVAAPSRDEAVTDTSGELWRDLPPDKLPRLSDCANASCAIGDDLFDPRTDDFAESLCPLHEIERLWVAWTPGARAWIGGGQLRVRVGELTFDRELPSAARVRGLAVSVQRASDPTAGRRLPRDESPPERLQLVVCHDSGLTAFEYGRRAGALTPVWEHAINVPPRGAAFLPAQPQQAWPDLLLAVRSGEVIRLRHVGMQVAEAWEAAWQRVETREPLHDLRRCLEWTRERLDLVEGAPSGVNAPPTDRPGPDGIAFRQGLLTRLLQRVFADLDRALPAERSEWIEPCAELLRNEEAGPRSPATALDYVLERLADWGAGRRALPLDDDAADFTPALVNATYERSAPFSIQERIDLAVRRLSNTITDARRQEPHFAELLRSSHDNADDVWERAFEDLDGVVRQCALGFERWANRFITTDFIVGDAPACAVEFLEQDERLWLVVARSDGLRVHEISPRGKVVRSGEPQSVGAITVRLARLRAPAGDRLLVATPDGRLTLHELDTSMAILRLVCELPTNTGVNRDAALVALAAETFAEHGSLYALGFTQGRRSSIRLWRFGDDSPVQEVPLHSAAVESIALAASSGGGIQMIVGLGADAQALLYQLDSRFRPDPELGPGNPLRRSVAGRVTVTRFDQPGAPRMTVFGDRDGFIWCIRLDEDDAHERLRWIYKLESPIIQSVYLPAVCDAPALADDASGLFLVASAEGTLVLLDARAGRRLWKHHSPVRLHALALGVREQYVSTLALALEGGVVQLLRLITQPEREAGRARAQRLLADARIAQWAQGVPSVRCRADQQLVKAMALYSQGRGRADELLDGLLFRQARAQYLRFLVANERGADELQERDLIDVARYRDLALLQEYQQGPASRWDALVARRLERHVVPETSGDNGPRARMNAQVARLRRFGAVNPTPKQLLTHRPADPDLEQPWVCLEFARLMVQALARHVPPERFVVALIDSISDLPPVMVAGVATACGQISPHTAFLSAARRAVDALAGRIVMKASDLSALATALRPHAAEHRFAALLHAVVELLRLAEPDPEVWSEGESHRDACLSALRRLADAMTHSPDRPGMCDLLWRGLRERLPAGALAGDDAPLKARQEWLSEAHTRRFVPVLSPTGEREARGVSQWRPLAKRLVVLVGHRVDRIAEQEIAYLRRLLRPRVELARAERGRHNDLHLELVLRPEGEAQVTDATIEIRAVGREGMRPLVNDEPRRQITFRSYSVATGATTLTLHGYVQPDQTQVIVDANLQAAAGYRHRGRWSFPVPQPFAESFGPAPFPHRLPSSFRAYCESVFGGTEPAVAAVFDTELGLEGFVHEACEGQQAFVFDLDRRSSEYGRDRVYETLDPKDIESWIREGFDRSAGRPLLFHPTGEFSDRLLRGEWPHVRDRLANILVGGGRRDIGSEQLIVVVSSAHAAGLRAPLRPLAWREAHWALRNELGGDAGAREAQHWIQEATGATPDLSAEILRRLGSDLRLIVRFIRTRTIDHRSAPADRHIEDFLRSPGATAILKQDLAALDAREAVCVLAGAVSEVQLHRGRLVPGLVPAVDHFSGKKRQRDGKLIQSGGRPFTARSLQAISSDRHADEFVRVEGYGNGLPTSGLFGSRLAALAATLDAGAVQVSPRAYAERIALATGDGAVTRTPEAARSFVRDLYKRQPAGRPNDLDQHVFQAVRDEPALLLHAVGLRRLPDMPSAVIDLLLAARPEHDRRTILDLARLWGDVAESRSPIDELRQLFGPPHWSELRVGPKDCDRNLADLQNAPGVRVFARGARDPQGIQDDYLFWLPREHRLSLTRLRQVLTSAEEEFKSRLKQADRGGSVSGAAAEAGRAVAPRLIVIGPGTAQLGDDSARRVAVLLESDILGAAGGERGLGAEIMSRVRAKLRLTLLSPYRTTGALPPGSSLFMGRETEMDFIRAGIRRYSILVVGGRRVGKTSLLNQARYWAEGEPDLAVVFVDCQGVETQEGFEQRLWESDAATCVAASTPPTTRTLAELLALLRAQEPQQLPILMLNEIDLLLERSPTFLASLRAYNDAGSARFLMVGYTLALHGLREPGSPLFHFTQGLHHGDKAIALAALDEQPARGLIDLLEVPPLSLSWQGGEKDAAYALLLDRSYRIPWVLQSYCHALIARLETTQREQLSLNDVGYVVAGGSDVLRQYFDMLEVSVSVRAVQRQDAASHDAGLRPNAPQGARELVKSGLRVVLTALARERYFVSKDAGDPAIHDPRLARRLPLSGGLGFTVGEARQIVVDTMRELLVGEERRAMAAWFGLLDLLEAFRELTLTLYLEPDPGHDERFGFLLHIYPRELAMTYAADPTLDKLFVDQAVEFWASYQATRSEKQ